MKLSACYVVMIACGLCIPWVSAGAEERSAPMPEVPTWTDVKGRPPFAAQFVKLHVESGEVQLSTPDQQPLWLKLTDFGQDSRKRLRALHPATRVWTDQRGRKLPATLLEISDASVTLWENWSDEGPHKARVFADFPLARLSPADRKFVEQEALKRVSRRVVMLEAFNAFDQRFGFGSAFYVDKRGWLATNYHVIRGAARLEFTYQGNRYKSTQCLAVDRPHDLAIVKFDPVADLYPPLRLGDAVGLGDDVWAIGFPGGLPNSSPGSIGNLLTTAQFPEAFRQFLTRKPIPFPANARWLQIQKAVILPGSSGGPLINTAGQVLGVNTWVTSGGTFGQAVHAGHLRKLMAEANQQPRPAQLPLPPADGESAMGWLHPEIAGTLRKHQGDPRRLRTELMKIAQRNPRDWRGLQSLALTCRMSLSEEHGNDWVDRSSRLLLEHHAEDRVATELALLAGASPHPSASDYCAKLVNQQAFDRERRVAASFGLVNGLLTRIGSRQGAAVATLVPLRAQLDAALRSWEREFAEEALRLELGRDGQPQLHLHDFPITVLESSVQGALGELFKEKATAPLGELAKSVRYRFENVTLGAKAPDFCGENEQGKRRCLRGLAGRVVLLDFFADWCGPCRSIYPLERKLVRQYEQDPRTKGKFIMVGVTLDPVPRIQPKIENGEITWNVCFDKPPANQPATATELYRVNSFPTMFLLDKQGFIRYQFVGVTPTLERDLEQAIDALLEER